MRTLEHNQVLGAWKGDPAAVAHGFRGAHLLGSRDDSCRWMLRWGTFVPWDNSCEGCVAQLVCWPGQFPSPSDQATKSHFFRTRLLGPIPDAKQILFGACMFQVFIDLLPMSFALSRSSQE